MTSWPGLWASPPLALQLEPVIRQTDGPRLYLWPTDKVWLVQPKAMGTP